jgi:hypothetical protein
LGTCKGNRGNLMQHWVFSEALSRISDLAHEHPLLVCTHSMSPKSAVSSADRHFKLACGRLKKDQDQHSHYEMAWRALTNDTGQPYPNSAALAVEIWKRKLSVLLCEFDSGRAQEIKDWLGSREIAPRLDWKECHQGDWRKRIELEITYPSSVDVLYIEQDPMVFSCSSLTKPTSRQRANVYPCDIRLLFLALRQVRLPIVYQLSSFSANGGNTHEATIPVLDKLLTEEQFVLEARVAPDGNMISHVYSRGLSSRLWVAQADVLADFRARFPDKLPRNV